MFRNCCCQKGVAWFSRLRTNEKYALSRSIRGSSFSMFSFLFPPFLNVKLEPCLCSLYCLKDPSHPDHSMELVGGYVHWYRSFPSILQFKVCPSSSKPWYLGNSMASLNQGRHIQARPVSLLPFSSLVSSTVTSQN